MPPEFLNDISHAFNRRIGKYHDTAQGVLWKNADGQLLRFELLAGILDDAPTPGTASGAVSVNDLGCGYGYLSCAAAQQGVKQIFATDNNAAALQACAANFAALKISGTVIAGDAGSQINDRFDTILCNPPFHQGFHIESELTDKFLCASKRLLAPHGRALFVVNNFIALEKKARDYFPKVAELARSGSFKLIMLSS